MMVSMSYLTVRRPARQPLIDAPLQSAPGRLFTVSRPGRERFVLAYSMSGSTEAPRFLTRRQSSGSTMSGTDREVGTSAKWSSESSISRELPSPLAVVRTR
jgi:hypothetical protein